MKRSIIYKVFGIASLAFAAFSAISCTEKEPDGPKETPVFPEMVTLNDIQPGTKLSVTFTPNMDWKLSIPEESFKWFKILDGKFEEQSISGKASRLAVRISIQTTSEESFSLRSTKVYLTMGGETKAIAEYMLAAKGRTVEVYPVRKAADNSFEVDDNGYVYSELPLTENDAVELIWNESDRTYHFPLKVKSNYEWTVQWPEWARADITAETRVGEVNLDVYGISSKLPLVDDGTESEIAFKNGDEVVKSFKVKIPSSLGIFDFSLSGYSSLSFDHAAYFHSGSGSYTKEPVMGHIYGPQASRAIVLDNNDGKYSLEPGSSWVNLNVGAWDSVEGASVLQQRELSVSVPRYSGNKNRSAMILILPATAPLQISEILTADRTAVEEEFAQYAISVTQSARPDEYITFEESEEAIKQVGIIFEKSTENLLPQKNFKFASGCEDWQYNISYVKEYAESRSAIFLTEAFASTEIYDAEGKQVTENLSEHWLCYTQMGDGLYGQISMMANYLPKKEITDENGDITYEPTTEIDGYVVFKDAYGEVLSIVHCFYVAEKKSTVDIFEDASNLFVNQEAAAAAGATLYQVVAGPTYELFKEQQAPIYVLTYTKNDTSLEVTTSKSASMYTPYSYENGKTRILSYGPEMVTIDNQIYYDYEYEAMCKKYEEDHIGDVDQSDYPDSDKYNRSTMGYLKYETSALEPTRTYPGSSFFKMSMPSGKSGQYKEVIQFSGGSNYSTLALFICILDLQDSAN